jgi:DNA-binding transcriptional LysR family regulator
MKTQNVTETARLLRVSQPAVSQALHGLESDLGFDLFVRLGGRIVPSDEARALIREVDRVFAQISVLHNRAEELRDERAGHLSVVTIPTLTHYLVPKAVAAMRSARPRLKIRIESSEQPMLLHLIKQEQADVGLTFAPVMELGVASEPVFRTRIMCCMPAGHPLANRRSVDVTDLAPYPIIALNPSTPPGLLLKENLEKRKVPSLDLIEINTAASAIALVKEGVGLALVDVMALYILGGRSIVAVPFEPEIPLVLTALFSRSRPTGRMTLQFIANVRAVLNALCVELRKRSLPGEVIA